MCMLMHVHLMHVHAVLHECKAVTSKHRHPGLVQHLRHSVQYLHKTRHQCSRLLLARPQSNRPLLAQVMMATQLNEMVRSGEIANGTVLKVDEVLANNVSNSRCALPPSRWCPPAHLCAACTGSMLVVVAPLMHPPCCSRPASRVTEILHGIAQGAHRPQRDPHGHEPAHRQPQPIARA